jgi:hypothetical protein
MAAAQGDRRAPQGVLRRKLGLPTTTLASIGRAISVAPELVAVVVRFYCVSLEHEYRFESSVYVA